MTKSPPHFFAPIFYHTGNLFICLSTAYIAPTEADAQAIGKLVDYSLNAIHGAEFTGEALEIGRHPQRYVATRLCNLPVAVLSGPLFTEAYLQAVQDAQPVQ